MNYNSLNLKGTQKEIEEALADLEKTKEEKAMQTQPLFTLTAEEVEELKQLLEKEISDLNHTKVFYSNLQLWLDKYNKTNNLLCRIKQWQDENNRTD